MRFMSSVLSHPLKWGGVFALVLLSACTAHRMDYQKAKTESEIKLPENTNAQRLGQIYPMPAPVPEASGEFVVPYPPTLGVQKKSIAASYTLAERSWVLNGKAPVNTWSELLEFWRQFEVPLVRQDVKSAAMETGWFTRALQPGYEVRYLLRLERGLQPENTEIYLYNQKRQVGSDSNPVWQELAEDDNHRQWLVGQLVNNLNQQNRQVADSLLATAITLPKKVDLITSTAEPMLSLSLNPQQSLASLTRSLRRGQWVTYEGLPSSGIFYADQLYSGDENRSLLSRINPFSSPRPVVTSNSTSPYSLNEVLRQIAWDKPEVAQLFSNIKVEGEAKPLSSVPGFILVMQSLNEDQQQLFIRGADGLPLAPEEARELLASLWRQLI